MQTKQKQAQTSPNDISAHLYDIVNSKIKPEELLIKELNLLESEIAELHKRPIKILDVGAGTGRHAIKLWKRGYNLTCVESSTGMVDQINEKLDKLKSLNQPNDKKTPFRIINSSIFDYNTREKFDLIILFWNTFNEIALDDSLAIKLINKLKSLLNKRGRIIMNMDDPEKVDFENLDFETEVELSVENRKQKWFQKWKTVKWDSRLNKSIALEEIFELQNNQKILITSTKIEQRWYSFPQLLKIVKSQDLQIDLIKSNFSEELYLRLS